MAIGRLEFIKMGGGEDGVDREPALPGRDDCGTVGGEEAG